jgi:hypothetical protein
LLYFDLNEDPVLDEECLRYFPIDLDFWPIVKRVRWDSSYERYAVYAGHTRERDLRSKCGRKCHDFHWLFKGAIFWVGGGSGSGGEIQGLESKNCGIKWICVRRLLFSHLLHCVRTRSTRGLNRQAFAISWSYLKIEIEMALYENECLRIFVLDDGKK